MPAGSPSSDVELDTDRAVEDSVDELDLGRRHGGRGAHKLPNEDAVGDLFSGQLGPLPRLLVLGHRVRGKRPAGTAAVVQRDHEVVTLFDLTAHTLNQCEVVSVAVAVAVRAVGELGPAPVLADEVHRDVHVLVPVHRQAVAHRHPPAALVVIGPVAEPHSAHEFLSDGSPLLVGPGVVGGSETIRW
ncbi:hypothetical protein [Amycolatopsis sp. A1MSW2902]|uniref:hypothetical protein n=1 Tax=Amycolatopsis sp. A1MSW2902 TaxID=687413 RepID=UPI00307D26CB